MAIKDLDDKLAHGSKAGIVAEVWMTHEPKVGQVPNIGIFEPL